MYIKIRLKSMLNIFFSSLLGCMILISNAFIFNYLVFKRKINEFNIYKDSLFGFILIGYLGLLINFFLPINKLISSIFLIFSLFIFVYFFSKTKKKKQTITDSFVFNSYNFYNYYLCKY